MRARSLALASKAAMTACIAAQAGLFGGGDGLEHTFVILGHHFDELGESSLPKAPEL